MCQFYRGFVVLFILAHHSFLHVQSADYYVDFTGGNDSNEGTLSEPWKTINQVSAISFQPGDSIYFKRGTSYSGCVTINGDGTADQPITISAYGSGDAPAFTNPDYGNHNGNAMRIRGDHQVVENLCFHDTAPAPSGAVSFQTVWSVGALHVSPGNDHVTIRNNEFANNAKAIQSYSEYSLITNNYIHDVNTGQQRGFLSYPYWGPIGIQLGIGNQEVSYNTIVNMYAVGGAFGSDGGAIEIDDGRNHKDNIHIHHNSTFHNMGFVELSYWDDIEKVASSNVVIDNNVSRDYQSFLLWWAPTLDSVVRNNTIIRSDNREHGPWKGVFIIDAPPGDIDLTKNIIVVSNGLSESIFIRGFDGAVNDVTHTDNCYWNVNGGSIDLGQPFGSGEIISDPLFVDFLNGDYEPATGSPAVGWGADGLLDPPVYFRPDGLVGSRANSMKGNQITSLKGFGQTFRVKRRRNGAGKFFFIGQNEGNAPDDLRFFMNRGNRRVNSEVFRITYGRSNVTAKMESSGYAHSNVPIDGEIKFLVKIKGPGKRTFRIRVTSEMGRGSDVMKTKVKKP
jgi:hypothetical protein